MNNYTSYNTPTNLNIKLVTDFSLRNNFMKTLTFTIIIFYLFYRGTSDENEFFLDKIKSFRVVQIHQK